MSSTKSEPRLAIEAALNDLKRFNKAFLMTINTVENCFLQTKAPANRGINYRTAKIYHKIFDDLANCLIEKFKELDKI